MRSWNCVLFGLLFYFLSVSAQAQGVDLPASDPDAKSKTPSPEVSRILNQVVPEFDLYLGLIADHLDSIEVTNSFFGLFVKARILTPDNRDYLDLDLRPRAQVNRFQPYRVRIGREVRFEIAMTRSAIYILNLRGLSLFLKIPAISDEISPSGVSLDLQSQIARVSATAWGGKIKIVADADVKERVFKGVAWMDSIRKSIPAPPEQAIVDRILGKRYFLFQSLPMVLL